MTQQPLDILLKDLEEKRLEEFVKLETNYKEQMVAVISTHYIVRLLEKEGITPLVVSYLYANIEVKVEDLPKVRKATGKKIKLCYKYPISENELRYVCTLEGTKVVISYSKPFTKKDGRCKIVKKVNETTSLLFVCEREEKSNVSIKSQGE